MTIKLALMKLFNIFFILVQFGQCPIKMGSLFIYLLFTFFVLMVDSNQTVGQLDNNSIL